MYEYKIKYTLTGSIIVHADTEDDALSKFDAAGNEELADNSDEYEIDSVECMGFTEKIYA